MKKKGNKKKFKVKTRKDSLNHKNKIKKEVEVKLKTQKGRLDCKKGFLDLKNGKSDLG